MTQTKEVITKRMAQKIDSSITGRAGKVSKHLAPLPASSPVAETIIAENEPDINNMTITELRQYAKDNSIDIKGLRKKADIIEAISDG